MYDTVRESAFGQIVRWVTKNKYFRYEEEHKGFEIPWQKTEEVKNGKDEENSPEESRRSSFTHGKSGIATPASQPQPEDFPPQHEESQVQHEGSDIERQLTRPDMEKTQSNIIVPKQTSDGVILVDWYTTTDAANPQNWSSSKKAYVTFVVFMYTLVVYASSSIYTSAQLQVQSRFGLRTAEASAILALYVAGYGLGPLLFSPLSEIPQFGRNIPYVVSFTLFVVLSVPTALVNNYPGLLVLRFLTGFMGSPCLATGGATEQDMYSLIHLPYALTAWVVAAFCAPAIGPILSGFAVPVLGWRWAFWEIVIMSSPVLVLWLFTMPETSADNILLRRARRLRKLTGDNRYMAQSEIIQKNQTFSKIVYEALLVPLLITIKDPAVLFINILSSVIYSIYYGFFEVFPIAYIGKYGFNIGELGIVFTATIIPGGILGIITYVSYQHFYLIPDLLKRGQRQQEHRLVPAVIAVWALPVGLFWFGWTANPDTAHWVVSMIGLVIFAYGGFVLFQALFMYLPLTYPKYAASLFATNDAFRSAMACGSIIYATPMYEKLGIGRGVSILGGLMVGGAIGVVVLYFTGAKLRARSRFAESTN